MQRTFYNQIIRIRAYINPIRDRFRNLSSSDHDSSLVKEVCGEHMLLIPPFGQSFSFCGIHLVFLRAIVIWLLKNGLQEGDRQGRKTFHYIAEIKQDQFNLGFSFLLCWTIIKMKFNQIKFFQHLKKRQSCYKQFTCPKKLMMISRAVRVFNISIL